jgi:nucleoside-diphosphate-sugar epimerase
VNADDVAALPAGPALVTGATGFLGASLIRRLVSHGKDVRALVRSPEKASVLEAQGVEVVMGDVSDEVALTAALDDVSVVFHLAGKLFEPSQPTDEYRKTHVQGTRLLIERSRRRPRLERFVHCSTTGVLGPTGKQPADEGFPIRPTNVYEATKAEAERAILAACSDGFPAVVARPGLVYGPGDLHLAGFFRTIRQHRFRPIGREPVWLHPIYIEDMTDAFLRCAVRAAAIGECFHFAGPQPATLEQLARVIALAEDTTLPSGRIPMFVARSVAAIGDVLPPRLKRAAPLTTSRLDFLTHSRMYSVKKAQEYLDFEASTDLQTGITRTVAWYREHGLLPT